MSECVVRMRMPSKNIVCGMVFDLCGVWYCPVKNRICHQPENGDIPSWCPIICQLPEGHGRLVDKDEVIESIRTEVTELFFNGLKGTPRPDDDLRFMWNRLEDEDFAPTIVPAERSEHERVD